MSCWDLNGNGVQDPVEDINGDGLFNAIDCSGSVDLTAILNRLEDLERRLTENDARLANSDFDNDGFTPATGDCDDSVFEISPGNVEIPNNGIDDDCDGVIDGDGGGGPPLGSNLLVNGDFEAFTPNGSGPFDPPVSWTSFGAIFNPGFSQVGYTEYGTLANGENIFPSTDPFPGFMMSRALKVFGRSFVTGGGDIEPSLGTLYQEFTGAAVPPAGTQLRLTGWAYHASQDPLGAGAEAYLVIKCFDSGFSSNLCAGTESTSIDMGTTQDTWLPFSVDLASLPAGTAAIQAGVEFKQCGGNGGTACADGVGSVFFDELVFSITTP